MAGAWDYVAGGYGAVAGILGLYALTVVRRRRTLARSAPGRRGAGAPAEPR